MTDFVKGQTDLEVHEMHPKEPGSVGTFTMLWAGNWQISGFADPESRDPKNGNAYAQAIKVTSLMRVNPRLTSWETLEYLMQAVSNGRLLAFVYRSQEDSRWLVELGIMTDEDIRKAKTRVI